MHFFVCSSSDRLFSTCT